jgi:RHS repeat-associated protein
MGLLYDFPDDLLKLIRNAAQYRNPNANSGAGDANDVPPWVPQPQQRLPLSFAGPLTTADITASSPSQPRPTVPLPGPADASAATDLSWLRGDRSANPLRAQPPARPAQNLTAQALRMKGVPEADIAAATGNPDLMKQLIIQHFGPGSAGTPARTGYAPYGSGDSFGDSKRRVGPEISGLDDTRARRDAPAWGRFISADPTGLSAGDINLYRANANNPVQLNGPSGLFFGPGPVPDPIQGRSRPNRWA